MITKEEYDAYIAALSTEKCGLAFKGAMTVRECNPPTQDNRKCGICGKELYK